MTATLTIDEEGRLLLPESALQALGIKPGAALRAQLTPNRIEILADLPVVTELVLERGVLVTPRMGIKADAAAAVRAERDRLAQRALGD